MKRTLIALTVTALAVGSAGVASAGPGNGNGAVKSGLAAATGLAPAFCQTAPSGTGKQTENGFVVLNAPGKPAKGDAQGPTRKLIGEVALKAATADAVYNVFLASSDGECGDSVGTINTNGQGNGNLNFQEAGKGAGEWYVVVTRAPADGFPLVSIQEFASAPVTIK